MIKISPSILSGDLSDLSREIKRIEHADVDLVHLDIMDGHFVPNFTFGPMVVKTLRDKTDLVFDVHLMIEKPERFITQFIKAGADILTFHVEAVSELKPAIFLIKDQGKKAGVALRPATPLQSIESILGWVDLVLIMSVNPGIGGQRFMEDVIPKIKELRSRFSLDIEVDGGVKPDNIREVVRAGANILVAGSFVFEYKDLSIPIKILREKAEG
ncbi:MAG: ribulose-phosphate 3-epimerase [bacterium]|nr:ribulose-phosphate 3-epimerase [bacterium]